MSRPSNLNAVVNGTVVSLPPKAFKALLQGIVSNSGVVVPESAKTMALTLVEDVATFTPSQAASTLERLFPTPVVAPTES